jgi:hypothetical protein
MYVEGEEPDSIGNVQLSREDELRCYRLSNAWPDGVFRWRSIPARPELEPRPRNQTLIGQRAQQGPAFGYGLPIYFGDINVDLESGRS